LVGENADGITVAFRGTLPPSLKDPESLLNWLEDFFAIPISAGNVPGQVHAGFYGATMSVIVSVAAAVQSLRPSSSKPVYVTGHSLGGAMASIGAYILNQTYGIPIQQVVTFASPEPGTASFQAGYQSVIPSQIRYENFGDIVPLLPPSNMFCDLVVAVLRLIPDVGQDLINLFKGAANWDYVPVGALQFIESAADHYKTIPDEPIESQIWDVVKEFGEDIWDFNFSSFAAAHHIGCGFGYMSAVCPAGVCG
jgi:hypothetical protein